MICGLFEHAVRRAERAARTPLAPM